MMDRSKMVVSKQVCNLEAGPCIWDVEYFDAVCIFVSVATKISLAQVTRAIPGFAFVFLMFLW